MKRIFVMMLSIISFSIFCPNAFSIAAANNAWESLCNKSDIILVASISAISKPGSTKSRMDFAPMLYYKGEEIKDFKLSATLKTGESLVGSPVVLFLKKSRNGRISLLNGSSSVVREAEQYDSLKKYLDNKYEPSFCMQTDEAPLMNKVNRTFGSAKLYFTDFAGYYQTADGGLIFQMKNSTSLEESRNKLLNMFQTDDFQIRHVDFSLSELNDTLRDLRAWLKTDAAWNVPIASYYIDMKKGKIVVETYDPFLGTKKPVKISGVNPKLLEIINLKKERSVKEAEYYARADYAMALLQNIPKRIIDSDVYAGKYLNENGNLVLLFTDIYSPLTYGLDSSIIIKEAQFSYKQLSEIHKIIGSNFEQSDLPIATFGFDESINRVVVGIVNRNIETIQKFRKTIIDSSMLEFYSLDGYPVPD